MGMSNVSILFETPPNNLMNTAFYPYLTIIKTLINKEMPHE